MREITRRTRERLDGQVVFAYRQLPSARRGPDAELAARAALAAARQGAFWEMHAALFEHSPRSLDLIENGSVRVPRTSIESRTLVRY